MSRIEENAVCTTQGNVHDQPRLIDAGWQVVTRLGQKESSTDSGKALDGLRQGNDPVVVVERSATRIGLVWDVAAVGLANQNNLGKVHK